MSAGYFVAGENFKEAAKHVSAETDPVMFNLLYGLQSLTNQIEADFASLWKILPSPSEQGPAKTAKKKAPGKKMAATKKPAKKAKKKAARRR